MERSRWTAAVRAGIDADRGHGSVVPPIYLSTNYRFSKAMDVGFRIRNATDALYAESAYGSTQALIANPRTYEVSVRLKF